MVCTGLEVMGTSISLVDYLVYPTTCFYYFYAIIFFGLFVILTFIIHNAEREQYQKADLISSMAVSSTAIVFLSVIATLIESTNGIPMLQKDIFLYVIAFWVIWSAIWFFKK